jgi:hypothetical protein
MYIGSKGQIGFGNVLIGVFFVLIVGILLSAFSGTINDFRLELIDEVDENTGVLYEIMLYAMMPMIWFLYIFSSIFYVAILTRASGAGI